MVFITIFHHHLRENVVCHFFQPPNQQIQGESQRRPWGWKSCKWRVGRLRFFLGGVRIFSRWWFQIFFDVHPYLGKIPILTHIFQMGWNHQLVSFFPVSWNRVFSLFLGGLVSDIFRLGISPSPKKKTKFSGGFLNIFWRGSCSPSDSLGKMKPDESRWEDEARCCGFLIYTLEV